MSRNPAGNECHESGKFKSEIIEEGNLGADERKEENENERNPNRNGENKFLHNGKTASIKRRVSLHSI
jgi:hypothetical protein